MGHGTGHGEGGGEGQGQGQGQGSGGDEQSMVIGGSLAIGLTICMCVCGIPLMIAGGVLLYFQWLCQACYVTGISILVISTILLVIAVIFIILTCTGVIGAKNRTDPLPHQPHSTVIVQQQGMHQGMHQPPPYQSGPPPGYSGYGQQPPAAGHPQQGPPPGYGQQGPQKGAPGNPNAHGQGAPQRAPGAPATNEMYPPAGPTDPAYPPQ